jgi:hypothetical protein
MCNHLIWKKEKGTIENDNKERNERENKEQNIYYNKSERT